MSSPARDSHQGADTTPPWSPINSAGADNAPPSSPSPMHSVGFLSAHSASLQDVMTSLRAQHPLRLEPAGAAEPESPLRYASPLDRAAAQIASSVRAGVPTPRSGSHSLVAGVVVPSLPTFEGGITKFAREFGEDLDLVEARIQNHALRLVDPRLSEQRRTLGVGAFAATATAMTFAARIKGRSKAAKTQEGQREVNNALLAQIGTPMLPPQHPAIPEAKHPQIADTPGPIRLAVPLGSAEASPSPQKAYRQSYAGQHYHTTSILRTASHPSGPMLSTDTGHTATVTAGEGQLPGLFYHPGRIDNEGATYLEYLKHEHRRKLVMLPSGKLPDSAYSLRPGEMPGPVHHKMLHDLVDAFTSQKKSGEAQYPLREGKPRHTGYMHIVLTLVLTDILPDESILSWCSRCSLCPPMSRFTPEWHTNLATEPAHVARPDRHSFDHRVPLRGTPGGSPLISRVHDHVKNGQPVMRSSAEIRRRLGVPEGVSYTTSLSSNTQAKVDPTKSLTEMANDLAKAFEEKRGDGAETAIVVRDQGPVLSPDKADAGTGRGQAADGGEWGASPWAGKRAEAAALAEAKLKDAQQPVLQRAFSVDDKTSGGDNYADGLADEAVERIERLSKRISLVADPPEAHSVRAGLPLSLEPETAAMVHNSAPPAGQQHGSSVQTVQILQSFPRQQAGQHQHQQWHLVPEAAPSRLQARRQEHQRQQQVEEAEQSELRKRRRHRQEQLVALKPELFGAGTGVDLNSEKEHTLDPLSTKREQQLDAQMAEFQEAHHAATASASSARSDTTPSTKKSNIEIAPHISSRIASVPIANTDELFRRLGLENLPQEPMFGISAGESADDPLGGADPLELLRELDISFEQLDLNGDGQITKEEFRAAFLTPRTDAALAVVERSNIQFVSEASALQKSEPVSPAASLEQAIARRRSSDGHSRSTSGSWALSTGSPSHSSSVYNQTSGGGDPVWGNKLPPDVSTIAVPAEPPPLSLSATQSGPHHAFSNNDSTGDDDHSDSGGGRATANPYQDPLFSPRPIAAQNNSGSVVAVEPEQLLRHVGERRTAGREPTMVVQQEQQEQQQQQQQQQQLEDGREQQPIERPSPHLHSVVGSGGEVALVPFSPLNSPGSENQVDYVAMTERACAQARGDLALADEDAANTALTVKMVSQDAAPIQEGRPPESRLARLRGEAAGKYESVLLEVPTANNLGPRRNEGFREQAKWQGGIDGVSQESHSEPAQFLARVERNVPQRNGARPSMMKFKARSELLTEELANEPGGARHRAIAAETALPDNHATDGVSAIGGSSNKVTTDKGTLGQRVSDGRRSDYVRRVRPTDDKNEEDRRIQRAARMSALSNLLK